MVTSGPSPDSGEAALAPPANPPLRSAASPPAPLPPPEPAALRPPPAPRPEQTPLATVVQVAAQLLYAGLVVAGLYYCFVTPRPHYRHAVRLQAPVDAAHQVTQRLSDARLVQQDRALALVPRIPPARTAVPMAAPAEAPLRVVVRNNLASAEIYHRLRELPPAEKLTLELVLPQPLREVTVQPGWVLEVDTTSDYARLALRRVAVVLPLLLLPLLLLGLWRRRRAAA